MGTLATLRGARTLSSDHSVRCTSVTILSVCFACWACGGTDSSSQGASAGTTQVASDSSVHSSGNATNRTDTDPRSLPDGGQSNLASNSGGASYTQPSPSGGNHSSSTAMSSGQGGTISSSGGVEYTGIALGACIGCDDGRMTGDESDVDCGGADCAPCQAGKRCSEARDCISGVCNRFVCAASP